MNKTYDFTERRKQQPKPRAFNEKRSDMVVISKANQADLYVWCLTVALSSAIVLVFLTIGIFSS